MFSLKSFAPNNVSGICSGVTLLASFGPLPRMPNPHVNSWLFSAHTHHVTVKPHPLTAAAAVTAAGCYCYCYYYYYYYYYRVMQNKPDYLLLLSKFCICITKHISVIMYM